MCSFPLSKQDVIMTVKQSREKCPKSWHRSHQNETSFSKEDHHQLFIRSNNFAALTVTDILIQTFQVMWKAVEVALGPKFSREKCDVKLVGTPLTHKRFLRRNRGTYGPAIKAGEATFPGQATPIPQIFCCGDSTFPGIGVPAVAASGAIVANTLVSVSQHSELLDAVGI